VKPSIRNRVTLTQAALTLAVLVPAGFAFYFVADHLTDAHNERRLDDVLRRTSQEIYSQLDDDVLVEFSGQRGPFAHVDASAVYWAVVRDDGTYVSGTVSFEVAASSRGQDTRLLTGRLPAPKYRSRSIHDLPEPVRIGFRNALPNGAFIRTKYEVEKGRNVTEIDALDDGAIVELAVLDNGAIVDRDREGLPRLLPVDLVEDLQRAGYAEGRDIADWIPYDGQLIAVVDRNDALGTPGRIGINRYGELYSVEQGAAPRIVPESRLWLEAAIEADTTHEGLFWALLIGIPVIWLLLIGIGRHVTSRALDPVRQIVDSAARIDAAQIETRLPVGKVSDELALIATTINGMLDRLEAGFEREKRFAGDASHELRGPLAKTIAEIDLALSRDRDAEEYVRALENCRRYADSLRRIVESLLLLSTLDRRTRELETSAVDIADLLVALVDSLDDDGASRVRLQVEDSPTPLTARGVQPLLRVALGNLLQNALRHGGGGQPVEIAARRTERSVAVEIADRGPGVPEDDLDRVFRRFARVDASRDRETGGVGLGLSIVREIVDAHDGTVALRNRHGGGLVATIELPAAPPD